jgi:acyl-CoA thioesterase-1
MPLIVAKFKLRRRAAVPGIFLSGILFGFFGLGGCRPRNQAVTRSEPTPPPVTPVTSPETVAPLIVAFGDSLTAGYGLSESQSYPSLLQHRLDREGYRYRVVNAGVSGDTSAGGVRRVEWALKGDVRFLILELGANDALRGQPAAETKKNLAQIIETAQRHKVTVILTGMEAPPNLGVEYTREFREVFRDLARQYNLALVPFFLEGIGGVNELNQSDGIHPNAKGTEIVVENIWRVLGPLLGKDAILNKGGSKQ